MPRKSVSVRDSVAGKVKRAVGELVGRPDLVIEGEAQDTGCAREDETPPPANSRKDTPGIEP